MKDKTGLSRAEIVVLAISVVLLVVICGIAGMGNRRAAKEVTCLSRLESWGKVFDAYARDHDNHFISARVGLRPVVDSPA